MSDHSTPSPQPHGSSEPSAGVRAGKTRGSITVHPLADQGVSGIPIDSVSITVLQESFEALKPHASTLTREFYRRLFEMHPPLRRMFPADVSQQEKKLAETLCAVIDGIRDPGALRQKLKDLGRLHAHKGVQAQQYTIVTGLLLECMASAAGSAWTPQAHNEWQRALEQISSIMLSGADERR